jgi:ketosteroid isomerase-like protein
MSLENVEIVRAAMDAFNRRGLAALTQRFDPEIEWAPRWSCGRLPCRLPRPRRDLQRARRYLGNLGAVSHARERAS